MRAQRRGTRSLHLLCAAVQHTLTCALTERPPLVDCSVTEARPACPQAQDVADGYVSDSAITAQMGVLNSVYNSVGFDFSLAGVDRTLNADWFQNLQSQTQQEADMTTELHKGNASVVGSFNMLPTSFHLKRYNRSRGTAHPHAHTHEGVRMTVASR